jgi:putative ABC transport system permease protein
MRNLPQDIRYALRMLQKAPGFTFVAIITLALGIGANTAIFSIVDAVLLRSLPFHHPEQLVKVTADEPGLNLHDIGFSELDLEDLQHRSGIFQDASAAWAVSANLTGGEHPERIELLGISPTYFTMLGVKPQLGRLFGPQDQAEGFAEGLVISDGLWHRLFGADPAILGRKLRLDGDLYTVIGVAQPEFRHPGRTTQNDIEAWASAGYRAAPFPKPARNFRFLPSIIGRLKPGVTPEQAKSRLTAMASEIRRDEASSFRPGEKWTLNVEPLQQSLVGNVKPMLLAIMAAVLLIILIASVNVANLLLARASARQREIAVRLALGAGKRRLFSQMLTESIVLSLIAGVAGVLTAWATLRLIVNLVPAKVPRLSEVALDWRVLAFAFGLTLITGVLFGLAPAIQVVREDMLSSVREGARGSGYSRRTGRLRSALIVSEVALALVLMVGGGLLLRTFWELMRQDPGFNPSHVVTANVWLPAPNDPKQDPYAKPEDVTRLERAVLRGMQTLPGVQYAGITSGLPITGRTFKIPFELENSPQSGHEFVAESIGVTPDYFRVIQTPLLSGRMFQETDEPGKDQVVLVDVTTARRFWPGKDAVGQRMRFVGKRPDGKPFPWFTVVGVIGNIKHDGLDSDPVPHLYASSYQFPAKTLSIALRTSEPASDLDAQIRQRVQAVDPNLPVFKVQDMDQVVNASLAPRRFSAQLVGLFAILALILSTVGIYGLLAYLVGHRRQEIGVRIALGAQGRDIRRLILWQGGRVALFGILFGLVSALLASRAIASLLYAVKPLDPLIFISTPLVLGVVALLASYIPARRAAAIDPATALRQE